MYKDSTQPLNDQKQFVRDRITQLRLEHNLSEYQLSLSLGKCKTYVQAITSGKTLPSFEAFFDLCDYFEITPEYFFQSPQKDNASLRRIYHKLEQLDAADLELIERVLDKF